MAPMLVQAGAKVILTSRKTGHYALAGSEWIAADLTRAEERRQLAEAAERQWGGIDLLINNAGAGAYIPSAQIDESTWIHMRELNLDAPIHLTRLLLPGMLERRRGLIVNVASIAAHVPLPWFSLYSTTKAGLLSFTHGLRMELDQSGVTTVAVCPGYVKTPFQANVLVGKPPLMLQRTKKFGITAEQCARAILRGIDKEQRTVVTPFSGHFLNAAYAWFPWAIDKLFAHYNRNLARQPE